MSRSTQFSFRLYGGAALVLLIAATVMWFLVSALNQPSYNLSSDELKRIDAGETIVKRYPDNPRIKIEMRKDNGQPLPESKNEYLSYQTANYSLDGKEVIVQMKKITE
ncbi:hypothetical protein ABHN11_24430 [Brevibacillus centrosporus]|uniref:hypothetical protein n=1 Tax=Brevibacillus centrosporus TaxID=54910 RepID=UPI003D23A568